MGFVNSWQQLTVTRVLLGAFEVSTTLSTGYGANIDSNCNAGMLLPSHGPFDLDLASVSCSSVRKVGLTSSFFRYKRHEVQKRCATFRHAFYRKLTAS